MTQTIDTATLEHRRRRAYYRATHRGTKELDWLVGKFATARLPGMNEDEITVFEKFLVVHEPVMHAWIMAHEPVDVPEFRGIVGDLRVFHKLGE